MNHYLVGKLIMTRSLNILDLNTLELIEIFFTNNLNDTKLIKNFLIKFINEIKDLGCLRNKNEYVHAIIKKL